MALVTNLHTVWASLGHQRDDLKVVAKIRNHFAHNYNSSTFSDQPVRDLFANLKQPNRLAEVPARLFDARVAAQMTSYVREITTTPRQKFEMTVIGLLGSLLRRVDLVRRVEHDRWFTKDPDPEDG